VIHVFVITFDDSSCMQEAIPSKRMFLVGLSVTIFGSACKYMRLLRFLSCKYTIHAVYLPNPMSQKYVSIAILSVSIRTIIVSYLVPRFVLVAVLIPSPS